LHTGKSIGKYNFWYWYLHETTGFPPEAGFQVREFPLIAGLTSPAPESPLSDMASRFEET